MGIGEVSTAREAPSSAGACESDPYERTSHAMATHHQPTLPLSPHPQIAAPTAAAAAAFHINRPSNPISAIMAPPPPLHHTSIILDDPDSYHVSRMMLQNEFQVRDLFNSAAPMLTVLFRVLYRVSRMFCHRTTKYSFRMVYDGSFADLSWFNPGTYV